MDMKNMAQQIFLFMFFSVAYKKAPPSGGAFFFGRVFVTPYCLENS